MSIVHLARGLAEVRRPSIKADRVYNTFCGIRTTEALRPVDWREAHDTAVRMGTPNPDENVCAECRAALVTERLTVQQD